MENSAHADFDNIPWEKIYAGRAMAEITHFAEFGACVEHDEDSLALGQLKLKVDWPLDSGVVKLAIAFPDSYPRLRPIVALIGNQTDFPQRHCAPDGTLCLLGRDSSQWIPSWTAAQLINEQLQNALNGSTEEDPQGEPDEYWWNNLGLKRSFCLFDSSWDVGDLDAGFLKLRYRAKGGEEPFMKAVVTEIQDRKRQTVITAHETSPDLGSSARSINVPWIKLTDRFFPSDVENLIRSLLKTESWPVAPKEQVIAPSLFGKMFAVLYRSELAFHSDGPAWMVGILRGSKRSFGRHGKGRVFFNSIPTFRSGLEDIGARSSTFSKITGKSVTVVGTGALGAPLVLELAKNGCSAINMIDNDIVEPGNSIRWPLGATAWGEKKVDVLKDHIIKNYPWCTPEAYDIGIGHMPVSEPNEHTTLSKLIEQSDVVVDATASPGVTSLLHDYSKKSQKSFISLWATPTLEGGAVVRYTPEMACPSCLDRHFMDGEIEEPYGLGKELMLVQPAGCSERTFPGSSFDLGEITFEAMRMVVETLEKDNLNSIVKILTMETENNNCPKWEYYKLLKHEQCGCS